MPNAHQNMTVSQYLELDAEYVAAIKAIDSGRAKWLSIKQAAVLLGLSVRQVRRYQADGKMPPRQKAGRELRYARSDIEKMLAEKTPETATQ